MPDQAGDVSGEVTITKEMSLNPMTIFRPTLLKDVRNLSSVGAYGGGLTWFAFHSGSPGFAFLGGALLFATFAMILAKFFTWRRYRRPSILVRTFSQTGFTTSLPGLETKIAWANVRKRKSTSSYFAFALRPTGQIVYWKRADFTYSEWDQIDQWYEAANPKLAE
jgi:hypothetical protein